MTLIYDETRSVQMEAGLMEIIWSLNRSGIYDTYFSLNRAIHPGGKVRIPTFLTPSYTGPPTLTSKWSAVWAPNI